MHSENFRRRVLLVSSLLVLAAGGLFLLLPDRPPPAPTGPSDIVLVVWDSCRGDRVSVNGYGKPTTPRLEEFARDAVVFRHCFTPSPWSPSAHASLFTGLLPTRHGLREGSRPALDPGLELITGTLHRAGYETVAVSANPLVGGTGLLRGFGTILPIVERGVGKADGHEVVASVRQWLEERRAAPKARRPLFLFVNLMDTHLPFRPPEEDLVAVHGPADAARVPHLGAPLDEKGALAHILGVTPFPADALPVLSLAYDGGVHKADRETGRLFDLLEAEGILPGALVAVTADHGEMLGEHGLLEHRMSLHEPVLHVPLVVRWPGRLDGGRREDAQVRLQDLYPTLLEAAGAEAPAACGHDAVTLAERPLRPRGTLSRIQWAPDTIPLLRGLIPGVDPAALERFRLETTSVREASVGPTGAKFVITRRLLPTGEVVIEERALYDLTRDPGEVVNLLPPGAGGGALEQAAALSFPAGPTTE